MIESLMETIAGAYDARRHRELLTALWHEERWFDTPHQLQAAHIARDALAEGRLHDARLAVFRTDGRTRFQDWMTHMAWDCPAARLTVADDGDVLADRETCPQSVVYWSGPLAAHTEPGKLPDAQPVTGPVVDGDALKELASQAVDGRFVLTEKPAVEMKRRLLGTRPLAVVSDFLGPGNGYTEDTTKWCNTWGDGPDGWYFHDSDTVVPGFMLSPAAGKRLRGRLSGKPDLKLRGFCQSRLYAGQGQCVTAVLPGEEAQQEVWMYAHACEQGAHDNCAGVSVIIEAVRMLKRLVETGRLPRPRRTVRVITTEECIGMAAFATLHDDLRRRALAGLNVDGAGGPSSEKVPFRLTYGPLSSPSVGWAVAALVGKVLHERARGVYRVLPRFAIPTADDMIADPNCGVPSLWLGQGGECYGYHSSADTPEICPDESLRNNAVLAAAWAYAMAGMDDRLAGAILPAACAWIESDILRPETSDPAKRDAALLRRWAAAGILRDLGRFGVSASVYEFAAARYAAPHAPPLADLPTGGPRYARAVWGTQTYETLPIQQRKTGSRWSNSQASGLYWTDGRRALPAVERLVRAETGQLGEAGLAPVIELSLQAGLMVDLSTSSARREE